MTSRPRVTVLQHRLLHYRVGLFEALRAECDRRGIELRLVHGQPSPRESLKKDTGTLAWADPVANRWVSVLGRDLLWQPFPRALRGSDLVVIMQENRILSNYAFLLKRVLAGTRVAYWGHGRNFQSDAPAGLLERWKSFWLTKVDWWFAYTNLTRKILVERGFPEGRITCLNNAIDNHRFVAELAGVSDAALAALAGEIGLAPGAPLGLYCGSLYPDKRLDLLADAAVRIHAAIPEFRLVVIGDGPSRPALEARLAGRDWARCVGVKKGPEKAAFFRRATAVLSPGAVGLHVLDAFCAGLPMFTTANARHGPEIEYLEHGRNGFVVPDDPAAYAAAVIAMLRDPARYAAVAAAASASAREYTLDNMVRGFVQGIAECLRLGAETSAGAA
jgi:glycosyltransferase involved in cell wall biosynthesis